MSSLTSYCFCCLSSSGLSNLFGSCAEYNYSKIFEDFFSIKVSKDLEGEVHVCLECQSVLNDVVNFSQNFVETLDILAGSRVLATESKDGIKHISKAISQNDEEYNDVDFIYIEEPDSGSEISDGEPDPQEPELEQNIIYHQREEKPKKSEPSYVVPEDLKCSVCGETQLNTHVFHTHMNQHFPNHVCEVCGKGFLTEKRLKRHFTSHDKGPFKCTSCEAVFENYNTMNSHRQRAHSSRGHYACPYCAQRFATFTQRATHLANEHGRAAPRSCPLCGKTFALSGNLSTHIRITHNKVKKYSCSECGAAFSNKSDLRGHVASHTGRNEFKCHMCPKSYPRKSALNVHLRNHTGVKPFLCRYCDRGFTQKCVMQKHELTHSRSVIGTLDTVEVQYLSI